MSSRHCGRFVRAALGAALILAGCDGDRRSSEPKNAPVTSQPVARELAAVDDPPVRRRTDWEELEQRLPKTPAAAAAALDDYRRRYGLPLRFYIRADAPPALVANLGLEEDDEGCGREITVFARRVPLQHAFLGSDPVIETDSAGHILRRWAVPNGSASPEVVVGVSSDEVIVPFSPPDSGVYLRYKPDGTYRVSAEPPPPFDTALWIMVADSVFLRVQPKDEGPFTAGNTSLLPGQTPGSWVPSGDSGWYRRVDSSGTGPRYARAVTRPWGNGPRLLICPRTAQFEGMICNGFPDGPDRHERRLAYPTSCS